MKKLALLILIAGLTAVPAASAGGWYAGYYGGHGHRVHHRGHHYRHYPRHHYRHRHDHYGALAAGLVFGGILHAVTRPAPVVVERRVIYRQPATASREVYPAAAPPASVAPAAEKPPYYYRRGADGSCDLIERLEDGSEIITPQPPEECD